MNNLEDLELEKSLEEDTLEEYQEPVETVEKVEKVKKPRSEKQIEAFKKVQEIRQQKRNERKEIKTTLENQNKKDLETKIVAKAISIKKSQIKKQKILEINDDDKLEKKVVIVEPEKNDIVEKPKLSFKFV
jgi:hypothetical protein